MTPVLKKFVQTWLINTFAVLVTVTVLQPHFRIHRPDHNLDRCRTQFKLVESIEQQEKAMQKFVDSL